MFFATIPKELLLIIRSYLVAFAIIIEENVEELETFVGEESGRSWRSFLAAINTQFWKSMRKETRIWSLNEKSFRKYLKDDWFRQYINDRMTHPSKQLHCRLFNAAKDPELNSLVEEIVTASNLGCINARGYIFSAFPSSLYLNTLSLGWTPSLERLGDFPNLEILQLYECARLTTIGKMEKLKELHLRLTEAGDHFMFQFPLEQLEKLVIFGPTVKDFSKFSHRLKSLKDLQLSLISFYNNHSTFTARRHPFVADLIKLRLEYFSEVDLTGLSGLRHLAIEGTRSHQISGTNEIYPQLKTFFCTLMSNEPEIMDLYRTEFTNVSEFTFLSPYTFETLPLLIHDRTKSLSVHVKGMFNILCSPNRSFHRVLLSGFALPDYSMFANVQRLYLSELTSLVDLSPFKDIPYLHLSHLSNVKDFSCLENQKYLKISQCDGVTDEAVSRFGNIFSLTIFGCGISVVKGLTHNTFISFESNFKLKEIHLPGKDYVCVSVKKSWLPVVVFLTGRIYSLETAGNKTLSVEGLEGNCSYLNGEEVESVQI
jgi:hypothetical protein